MPALSFAVVRPLLLPSPTSLAHPHLHLCLSSLAPRPCMSSLVLPPSLALPLPRCCSPAFSLLCPIQFAHYPFPAHQPLIVLSRFCHPPITVSFPSLTCCYGTCMSLMLCQCVWSVPIYRSMRKQSPSELFLKFGLFTAKLQRATAQLQSRYKSGSLCYSELCSHPYLLQVSYSELSSTTGLASLQCRGGSSYCATASITAMYCDVDLHLQLVFS